MPSVPTEPPSVPQVVPHAKPRWDRAEGAALVVEFTEQRGRGSQRQFAREAGVPVQINSAGSLLTIFFNENPIKNYDDAKKSDTKKFAKFFTEMLDRGIFLPPSQYEALFISAAHTEAEIDHTIQAAKESIEAMRQS